MKAIDGFKIWEVGDGDWIWGPSFASAVGAYQSDTGMTLEEILGDDEVNSRDYEISEEDLDRLNFLYDPYNSDKKATFRERLKELAEAGEDIGTFACSNF